MQKKLLSIVMIIGFGVIHCGEINIENNEQAEKDLKSTIKELCDDHFGKNEDILTAYETKLITDYTSALIKAVSDNGDVGAIEGRFKDNQTNNKKNFENKNSLLDDGKEGWFNWGPTPATDKSVKGLLYNQWQDLQTKQDEKNKTYQNNYAQHQKNYNEHVKGAVQNRLRERHYNLFHRYANGLDQCGNNVACLKKRDISWGRIQNPDFLNAQDEQIFDDLYTLITKNNIPLSRAELIKIAGAITHDSQDPHLKGKLLIEQIALGKTLINEKVHRILNPESEDKPNIDLTGEDHQKKDKPLVLDPQDDQNNQGALSE